MHRLMAFRRDVPHGWEKPAMPDPLPIPSSPAPGSPGRIWAQRASLLQRAEQSPALQALLLAYCKKDIVFWFNHFCWTFDPRAAQPHRPFRLYPYQEKALRQIVTAIENGEDLLIEKSRDMGVSWLVLLAFQYLWLFRPGANFHLGSRKEDFVDTRGDISTLMEKLRYNLDWLPAWMKPEGFDRRLHDNIQKLVNPANGNVITGESSNLNFGRGGRYKAVLFDEFPFWPGQDAAFASAGQSSPCRLVVGTPYGKANRFAGLRFSGLIKVLSIHWREHPDKDALWYEQQKKRMSEDEVARELDINYELSLRERVFRNFSHANKGELAWSPGLRVIRSWDFGYHCPACVFLQIDADGRVLVLDELVGSEDLLIDFAARVLEKSRQRFPEATFEDICDPAGAQRSDKSNQSSIEILNTLKIYPHFDRSGIMDGVELIRMKLSERVPAPDAFGQPQSWPQYQSKSISQPQSASRPEAQAECTGPTGLPAQVAGEPQDLSGHLPASVPGVSGLRPGEPAGLPGHLPGSLPGMSGLRSGEPAGLPGLVIDPRCLQLIAAFEGGYRYAKPDSEMPLQEHPYEDVMDCLRYAVMVKCGLLQKQLRKPRAYRPRNRYTGY